jgi:hypothetical protein
MPVSRKTACIGDGTYPTEVWLWGCRGEVRVSASAEANPFDDDEDFPSHGTAVADRQMSLAARWNPETGCSELILDPAARLDAGSLVLALGETLSASLQGHTALCRVGMLDPAARGLVAYRLPNMEDANSLMYELGAEYCVELPEASAVLLGVDPAWLSAGYGWFAADADPSVFGTPFVAPYGELRAEDDADDSETPGWLLCQVGIDDPLYIPAWAPVMGSARWDAPGALDALVAQVTGLDPETALISRVLSAPAEQVATIREQQHAQQRADARAGAGRAYTPAAKLRPRLVQAAVQAAADVCGVMLNGWNSRRPGMRTAWVMSCNVEPQAAVPGRRQRAEVPQVGVQIVFRGRNTDRQMRAFLTQVQEQLNVRQLGRVAIVMNDGDVNRGYVFADPALLEAFPAAFGVSEDETLVWLG